MKLSVSMCVHDYGNVARSISFFHRAVKSILKHQDPDEILLLVDISWDIEKECRLFPGVNFTIKSQERIIEETVGHQNIHFTYSPSEIAKYWGHTKDLVINSILKAKYDWVRTLDLDDEMRGDVRPLIKKSQERTAMITGITVRKKEGSDEIGVSILSRKGCGSANVFYKQAVKEASAYWQPGPWPDVLLSSIFEKLDWKIQQEFQIFSVTHIGEWNTRFTHQHICKSWKETEKCFNDYFNGK